MKITCQACGAKYTIADDKVRGRKVKIRCKGCSAPIVVDAQQGGVEAAGEAAAPVDQSEALEASGLSAPPPADAWSVNLSDTDQRTMSTDEIIAAYASGLVTNDAFVWKEGMGDWVALLDCAELAPLLGAAAPPAAAAPAPAASPFGAASPFVAPAAAASPKPAAVGAKRAGGRDAGAVDLFGGVQHAGSEEEEIATSAPQLQHGALPLAGSSAYGDDKMTGQRNENSVLFSLDSLKAGLTDAPKPAASSPKKGAAPPRRAGGSAPQQPSDPFGMGGGANDLMNLGGGGNALFNMNANQALLTAPAPPEPPPPRATDLGLSGPMSYSAGGQKKSKGLIIGAAIAVVGLIVIGAVAMSGGEDKSEGTAPSATAENAAAMESPKTEEKKEEPKPAEPPKTEATAAPSAAPTATSAAPSDTPKSTSPGPVSGTKPKEKEKEEPAAAPANGPFSISAAQAALGLAAGSAGSCKKPGGPTGGGKVQVTFAPSGRVTSANVAGPPFAGTAVGGCVAGVFRRAKVPPFSGNPVTVSKSFSVN